jgi:hypothetical protein
MFLGLDNVRDFSLISTEFEMIGHTNPTRQRGFRKPLACGIAAEPSLARRVSIRDGRRHLLRNRTEPPDGGDQRELLLLRVL